jgi:DNA invertase Pin-like site-specific DNA recombinase
MKAIGYVRVVPDEKAGDAMSHQEERIQSYCNSCNWQLISVFREEISGDALLDDRPRLKEAIAALDVGMTLVVVRLDRLSGQAKLVQQVVAAAKEKGATVQPVAGAKSPGEMRSSLEITSI